MRAYDRYSAFVLKAPRKMRQSKQSASILLWDGLLGEIRKENANVIHAFWHCLLVELMNDLS